MITDLTKAMIAATLNLFPEVEWDRMTIERGDESTVFGWIAREDGRSDFYVVLFEESGAVYFATTSSAKHSVEFYERLAGTPDGHVSCQRVEDVLGELVDRKVTLSG